MTTLFPRTALLALALAPLAAMPAAAEEAMPAVDVEAATDIDTTAKEGMVPAMPAYPMPPAINRDGGTAIINFVAGVNDKTVASLAQSAQNAVIGGADAIRINISSRGGSVYAMHFAVNVLQNLPVPVHTVAMSPLASAAVALFCAGEKRYMPKGSGLYLHQQRGYHTIENKNAAAVARENEMGDVWYDGMLRDCTDGDADHSLLDYSSRDTVIDAEQAKALGMSTGPMSELHEGKIWGMVMNVVNPDKPQSMGMPYATYR